MESTNKTKKIAKSKVLLNKFISNELDHQAKKRIYRKRLKCKYKIENNIMTLSKNLANSLNMM
jgi:hypothetical protein